MHVPHSACAELVWLARVHQHSAPLSKLWCRNLGVESLGIERVELNHQLLTSLCGRLSLSTTVLAILEHMEQLAIEFAASRARVGVVL